MAANLDTKIIGRFGNHIDRDEDKKPTVYEVIGLSPESNCFICYAGWNDNREDQWCLDWVTDGERITPVEVMYSSTKEALRAMEEILNKRLTHT